jgi:hypothetical protein
MSNRHMAPACESPGNDESRVEAVDRKSAQGRMAVSLARLGLSIADHESTWASAHRMHSVADAADRLYQLGARPGS